ncbi:hypothetical protein DH2020_029165 [Rehmannia glutinosa]|uniref:AMP-dependent synthetase/ligase domain-containing protein n=1 Tax=Rehmannia glutinosa TaxID=99300 RepID=A0ABR0VQA6_REHGL
MTETKRFIVEIEKAREAKNGKPSIGPVYRNVIAKDGFRPLPQGLDNCWDSFCQSVKLYPNNRMLGEREMAEGKAGRYMWLTYRQVHDIVLRVGTSIRSCGVTQACNAHGLHCVPLYDTLGAGAVDYIICHAEISIAFVEETKISEVLKTFPSTEKYLRSKLPVSVSFRGSNKQFDIPIKTKTDICTIMYTSGTTGDPKGVMITNESILSIISGVNHHLETMNEEDIKQLLDDIKELKPTALCAVPRVLDRIYSGLVEKISSAGVLRHTLFNAAYSYKLRNMSKGYKHVEAAPVFDKLIFNKVKESLGGNLRLILSGAAPLSSTVETFLRVVTGAHVLQGYGLTETCAGSFVARPDELTMIGTVGPPLPIVDICLESVPDMGYDALSHTPRGEICIRGKCLFSGYYKREDLTKEVMIDEWFHTGDIGEWQGDGSMKIIDRKKNIFKLSQGEYVSVEYLESIYSLASSVEAIWIYGNSYESFLVAVVNPNMESLERWAEVNQVTGEINTICEDPRARQYILEELTKIGKEKKLKGFEFIKAVHLDPIPFDMDRDLLTPTYKKKRNQFFKYYQNVIEDMYKKSTK